MNSNRPGDSNVMVWIGWILGPCLIIYFLYVAFGSLWQGLAGIGIGLLVLVLATARSRRARGTPWLGSSVASS